MIDCRATAFVDLERVRSLVAGLGPSPGGVPIGDIRWMRLEMAEDDLRSMTDPDREANDMCSSVGLRGVSDVYRVARRDVFFNPDDHRRLVAERGPPVPLGPFPDRVIRFTFPPRSSS